MNKNIIEKLKPILGFKEPLIKMGRVIRSIKTKTTISESESE